MEIFRGQPWKVNCMVDASHEAYSSVRLLLNAQHKYLRFYGSICFAHFLYSAFSPAFKEGPFVATNLITIKKKKAARSKQEQVCQRTRNYSPFGLNPTHIQTNNFKLGRDIKSNLRHAAQ